MNHVDITQLYIVLPYFAIKLEEDLDPNPNHDPDPDSNPDLDPDPNPDTPSLYNSQSNCV